jgi:signal transduction histidine kinase
LSGNRPRLGAILTKRIAFFAILAMLVQLAVVISDYYWNVGELSRLYVEQETERLSEGISVETGNVRYELPETIRDRYRQDGDGYLARIRAADGTLVFESCDAACEDRFLPKDIDTPDFWLRSLKPGKPLTLVGGRAFLIGDQRFLVDVATLGDPQEVVSDVLWNEIIEHLIVPMSILLVLVLGATLLSVRQALRPVRAAADAADQIDPMDARSHLKFDEMPREIAHLAVAVNRAFDRVAELMKSQKTLTSGIAHEIRTPLAAMKLELGRIDHPRARKVEVDLDDLVRFVSQLTTLARLESFDHGAFETVDLITLSASAVEQVAPWVYENQHSLELITAGDMAVVQGIPALLRDAIRNLVENAVRHTPDQSHIVVRVGPHYIEVEDCRPAAVGQSGAKPKAESLGIGLKIITRIAEIHCGELQRSSSATGSVFTIAFQP